MRDAPARLIEQGVTAGVREIVADSWLRSVAAGIKADTSDPPITLDQSVLSQYRDEHPLSQIFPLFSSRRRARGRPPRTGASSGLSLALALSGPVRPYGSTMRARTLRVSGSVRWASFPIPDARSGLRPAPDTRPVSQCARLGRSVLTSGRWAEKPLFGGHIPVRRLGTTGPIG
jgi:hypothetical protein